MYEESAFDARNTYAGASSSGCAGRPIGTLLPNSATFSGEAPGVGGVERRPDRARRHGVHANAALDQILRKRLGERIDRALGGRVVRQGRRAEDSGDRARHDDRRARLHVAQRRSRETKIGVDVGLERAVEFLVGHLFQRLLPILVGGIRNEDIEFAELLDRAFDGLVAKRGIGEITLDQQAPLLVRFDVALGFAPRRSARRARWPMATSAPSRA